LTAERHLRFLLPMLHLARAPHDRKTLLERLELMWEQLVALDEDMLAHAHLAEVVEQRGVSQLAELLRAEADAGIGPHRQPIEMLGDADGEQRHALGVTGRRRIARFDRVDRGADE